MPLESWFGSSSLKSLGTASYQAAGVRLGYSGGWKPPLSRPNMLPISGSDARRAQWGPKWSQLSAKMWKGESYGDMADLIRVHMATKCDGPGPRSHGCRSGPYAAISEHFWPVLLNFGPLRCCRHNGSPTRVFYTKNIPIKGFRDRNKF